MPPVQVIPRSNPNPAASHRQQYSLESDVAVCCHEPYLLNGGGAVKCVSSRTWHHPCDLLPIDSCDVIHLEQKLDGLHEAPYGAGLDLFVGEPLFLSEHVVQHNFLRPTWILLGVFDEFVDWQLNVV